MKKFPILTFLILTTFSSMIHAEDNLIGNGDFNEGIGKWTGDRKIENVDENPAAIIELGSNKKKFQQTFNGRGLNEVEITMRYKASEDFKGKGFQVLLYREGTDMDWFWTRPVTFNNKEKKGKKDGKPTDWKTFKWKIDKLKSGGHYSLKIEINSGEGKLYFDDISITGR